MVPPIQTCNAMATMSSPTFLFLLPSSIFPIQIFRYFSSVTMYEAVQYQYQIWVPKSNVILNTHIWYWYCTASYSPLKVSFRYASCFFRRPIHFIKLSKFNLKYLHTFRKVTGIYVPRTFGGNRKNLNFELVDIS